MTDMSLADNKEPSGMPLTEEERNLASMGYFGFLCVLPLLKKDSEFCQWHGKQALVLNIFIFCSLLILLAFPTTVDLIGPFIQLVRFVLFFGYIIIILYSYTVAQKGGKWKIPYLKNYIDKFPNL